MPTSNVRFKQVGMLTPTSSPVSKIDPTPPPPPPPPYKVVVNEGINVVNNNIQVIVYE